MNAPSGPAQESAKRRFGGWRLSVAIAALIVIGSSPFWLRRSLQSMSFFAVRRVEIQGTRYLLPPEIVASLGVDTTASVWDDIDPLVRRLQGHPQVESAEIHRKLPGTLVVRVTERRPVALVPGPAGLKAVDFKGKVLPIDPVRSDLDLPIFSISDTALLGLLERIRESNPALFARVSELRRAAKGELLLYVAAMPVRAMADVSAARLAEIIPVEHDLARRQARAVELDLRYKDQVIARLQ